MTVIYAGPKGRRHIPNAEGRPLCEIRYKFSKILIKDWHVEDGDPSCAECIEKAQQEVAMAQPKEKRG